MAPVNAGGAGGPDGDPDRGQLMLVSAIVIAVTFVALAVILNSAIFTQNLATRTIDVGASDAIEGQSQLRRGAGGIADRVNENGTALDYGALNADYLADFGEWNDSIAKYGAAQGTALRVEVDTTSGGVERISRGTQVVHGNTSTDLTPRGGTPVDWNVTDGARVRQFTLTVAGANQSSNSTVTTGLADGDWSDDEFFQVDIANGTSTERKLAVYENPSGHLTVAGFDNATGTTAVCSRTVDTSGDATMRIDVGRGTIQGEACGILRIDDLATSGPYTVRLANSDNVTASFRLTADRPINESATATGPFTDAVDTRNHGTHCSGPTYFSNDVITNGTADDYPFTAPAIYGVELDYGYRSDSVEVDATPRAERNELEGAVAHTPKVRIVNVTDTSGTNPQFEVDWTVADPDADLAGVNVTLQEPGLGAATFNDSATDTTIGGRTASGTAVLEDLAVAVDKDYDISVRVTDAAGNSRSVTRRHTAELGGGNDSGCPP